MKGNSWRWYWIPRQWATWGLQFGGYEPKGYPRAFVRLHLGPVVAVATMREQFGEPIFLTSLNIR